MRQVRQTLLAAAITLVALPGIGPWTADIYLLLALRRPDIWPRGDLALNKALMAVKNLGERTLETDLAAVAAAAMGETDAEAPVDDAEPASEDAAAPTSAADSAETALDLIPKKSFAALIMDLMMPQMDGLQAAKEIKRNLATVRTMILSGASVETAVLDALEALQRWQETRSPVDFVHFVQRREATATMTLALPKTGLLHAQQVGELRELLGANPFPLGGIAGRVAQRPGQQLLCAPVVHQLARKAEGLLVLGCGHVGRGMPHRALVERRDLEQRVDRQRVVVGHQ